MQKLMIWEITGKISSNPPSLGLFYNRDKLNLTSVEDNDNGNTDNEQNG